MTREAISYLPPIIAAIAFAMIPHVIRLPAWIIGWCVILWSYPYLVLRYRLPFPGKWVCRLLTIIGFLGLLVSFGARFGGNAYIGLLAIMAGLKPLEVKSHRDRMISVFLAYFIAVSSLLKSETLLMTIYMFPSVILTTSVLIRINHPAGIMTQNLKLSAKMMLQALPLMIILFILFPRIQGSIWGLAREASGMSGFSDYLAPGSISHMVEDDTVAFRVEFTQTLPQPEHLYWRGIVFTHFNGRGWSQERGAPWFVKTPEGNFPVDYTVLLEPHDHRWLFALDLPITMPPMTRIRGDYTLHAYRPIRQKIRYRIQSYLDYNTGPIQAWEDVSLQLPDSGNPQARRLADTWRRQFHNPEQIVEAAIKFFQENGFKYTLQPPLLGTDPVDDFLFKTRKGYCEHYASAFAFVMRAANIPARIVGGYLGGEMNPYGNYLIVRQSDAHAWNEVWIESKGWVRIDPTEAVAPGRIMQGLAGALSSDELPSFLLSRNLQGLSYYIREALFMWDTLNNQWDQLMGYSFEEQKSVLERLGIETGSWIGPVKALGLAVIVISLMAIGYAIWHSRQFRVKKDDVQRVYEKFCDRLARIGLPRSIHQGPVDYMKTISASRKDLKKDVSEIIRLYIRLRYESKRDDNYFHQFKTMVRQFKPREELKN